FGGRVFLFVAAPVFRMGSRAENHINPRGDRKERVRLQPGMVYLRLKKKVRISPGQRIRLGDIAQVLADEEAMPLVQLEVHHHTSPRDGNLVVIDVMDVIERIRRSEERRVGKECRSGWLRRRGW